MLGSEANRVQLFLSKIVIQQLGRIKWISWPKHNIKQIPLTSSSFRSFVESFTQIATFLFYNYAESGGILISVTLSVEQGSYLAFCHIINKWQQLQKSPLSHVYGINGYERDLLDLVVYYEDFIESLDSDNDEIEEEEPDRKSGSKISDNYSEVELWTLFQEMFSVIKEAGRTQIKNKSLFQTLKENTLFRQISIRFRLEDKYLLPNWIAKTSSKFREVPAKFMQHQRNKLNCMSGDKALNQMVKGFFEFTQKHRILEIKLVESRNSLLIQERKSQQRKNNWFDRADLSQAINSQTKFKLREKDALSPLYLSYVEFKLHSGIPQSRQTRHQCFPQPSDLAYHLKLMNIMKEKDFQTSQVDLQKVQQIRLLSAQLYKSQSELIDSAKCKVNLKEFYNISFAHYLDLTTFGIDVFLNKHQTSLIIRTKIKQDLSMNYVNFLEIEQMWDELTHSERLFFEQKSFHLEYLKDFSQLQIFSEVPCSLLQGFDLMTEVLKSLDELLIIYVCLEPIILGVCRKSVYLTENQIQYAEQGCLCGKKELQIIAKKFKHQMKEYNRTIQALTTRNQQS